MGVYYHVYAGPVLVCKFHQNEVVTKKNVKFMRCAKGHKGDSRYCPKCGQPMTADHEERESKRQEKSVTNIFDLMLEGNFREDAFDDCWGGLNNEKLIDSHDVLAPNDNVYLGREARFEANEFALILRGVDTAAEIKICEARYAKEIAFLRTHYDSVSVEWVVLTTGS